MKTATLLVPCFLILLSCQDIFAKQGFFWYKGDESNHEDTLYNMLHCLANNEKDCTHTWGNDKRRVPEISDALKGIKPNMDKGYITGVKFPKIEQQHGSAPIIKKMFEELKEQFNGYLQKVERKSGLKQKLTAEVVKKHADISADDVQQIIKGIVESHFLVYLLEPWLDILTNYLKLADENMVGVQRWKAVDAVKTLFENVEEYYDAKNFSWPDTNFGWLGEADSTATVVSG
ncbi:hypothetical protein DdX_09580 [Ditylenchus destructor]|uniref:Uncharacterized protein n=1 Tax=Ditylenchus destructor TaxID=166010 RepID=A0AAD4QZZ3_9BILA|nr:hypothetical protein DdX_09580 [Ditylenchus destructor]